MVGLVQLVVMSASTSAAAVNLPAFQAAADSQAASTAAPAQDTIQRGTAANLAPKGSTAPESAAASTCVTDTKWRNWRTDNCAAYEYKGYCAGGRVLNASMAGPTSGYPEWACCACNYRAVAAPSSAVSQVLFYVTFPIRQVPIHTFLIWQVLFYATHKLEQNDRLPRSLPPPISRI